MADTPKKRDKIIDIAIGARSSGGALLYAIGESGDICTLDDRYDNARWARVRVSPLLRKRPAAPSIGEKP